MKNSATQMAALERRIARQLAPARVASPVPSLALGLSGGMDSMVLAEACLRQGVRFVAWHFDHSWRGAQSRADATWVKAWCRARKIPHRGGKAGVSLKKSEGEARRLRWEFFRRQAVATGVGELWLAHHADDRAETLLLQLMRGAGPEGMSGPRSERDLFGLRIRRPLVSFQRSELVLLARHWKVEWREDPSNRDVRYRRNAVRHRLLPYLDRLAGRAVAPLLARTAEILEEENHYWDMQWLRPPAARLSVAELRTRPVAWQRRLLRKWLVVQGIEDAGFDEVEAVRTMLEQPQPSRVNLSKGRHARRTSGFLWIQH